MFAWQIKDSDNLPLASLEEFQSIQQKYPGLLPIIIHPIEIEIQKIKYLTRSEISLEQFAEIVRQYCLHLDPQIPLFFSINGVLIPKHDHLGKIYDQYKKSDGFLHIILRPEPFGNETGDTL